MKAALSAHEDIGTIQGLFDSGKVPNDVRIDLWKVQKKFDTSVHASFRFNFKSYSVVGPSFVLNHISEVLCSFFCLVTMVTVLLTVGLFECVSSS